VVTKSLYTILQEGQASDWAIKSKTLV
jgi:hypothetical protein